MIRFQYHSVIHPQNLSDFRESRPDTNTYLLVGVTGLNAKTLANSSKWAELEKLADDAEGFTQKIESICRLFTERYQQTQRMRDGESGVRPAGEIIESLAVLLLNADGKSHIYQAGKCSVAVLKRSGAHFPVNPETALSAIELSQDDRLVVDLQNADVVSSLRNFASLLNPSDTTPDDVAGFDYPFALTYAVGQYVEDPVIQPAPAAPIAPEAAEAELPPPVPEVPEEPVKEVIAPKPVSATKTSGKSRNPIMAGLFVALALTGAAILGWEHLPATDVNHEPNFNPAPFATADIAMRQAEQSLADGHNEKALTELARAEKIYEQYLSAHPTDTSSEIKLKINEIRQKKQLLESVDDF